MKLPEKSHIQPSNYCCIVACVFPSWRMHEFLEYVSILVTLGAAFLSNDPNDGHIRGLLYPSELWLLQAGWANENVRQAGRGWYQVNYLQSMN